MGATRDPQLPVARLFQRGITAFKAEDYQRAIQCFDQALQASSNESIVLKINILDSRAAAKEKLNDIKSSLSDAKQAIDLAPESPKGYLRAARLFNKIDRFPASIKMFELAITRLNSSPKKNASLIETLQAELRQVRLQENTRMTAPEICRAPSSSASLKAKSNFSGKLPFEIFIDIVASFDIPTRFRCMAVCSSWRQTILNTPHLWNTLSLNSHTYQKLMTKAKYWFSRLGPDQPLHTLSISVSPIWPPSTTHNLLTLLAEELSKKTSSNARLRSFSFHQAGVSYGIGEIQKTFSDVIAFVYSHRAHLFNLELQVPAFITCPLTLPAFLADFPSLKGLKLQGERGQPLLFIKSTNFYRSCVSSSKPTISGLVAPGSNCLSPTAPLNTGQQTENVLKEKLETLFVQCVSFVPSEERPINISSLRSISLISTAINAISPDSTQINTVNQYVPGIDFTCLPKLENLDLCRVAVGQEQWEPVWRSLERLSTLRRLRLEGLPHFIPHFLDLANVPPGWSPQDHVDQPFKVEMEAIMPDLEFISLSSLDSSMSYKFLAVFGYQFLKLNSLSVAGLLLDSETEPFLISALRHLPPLVNLNLSNTHARAEVIDAIKPDRLRHLQLGNCTRLPFRSLTRLATPNNLQFLDITGCHLISTREMLDWLARRVKVLIWREGQHLTAKSARRLFLD